MTIHYTALDTKVAARSSGNLSDHSNALDRSPSFYCAIGKRCLDLALIFLALPMVVPLVAMLALFVMRDGANPFYCQMRLGRKGKVYKIWKLRTMVSDAEALLEAHLASDPQARAEWNHTQKLKHDPRITHFGMFLRKTSLDELPQLWNVAKGDMSLVGPRPMMLNQRVLYPGKVYETLRPGITGPWQVSARNNSSFAERANFDTDYHARVSLMTDLRLLLATIRVVLRGTGY